jgi:hypothetical protein
MNVTDNLKIIHAKLTKYRQNSSRITKIDKRHPILESLENWKLGLRSPKQTPARQAYEDTELLLDSPTFDHRHGCRWSNLVAASHSATETAKIYAEEAKVRSAGEFLAAGSEELGFKKKKARSVVWRRTCDGDCAVKQSSCSIILCNRDCEDSHRRSSGSERRGVLCRETRVQEEELEVWFGGGPAMVTVR